MRNGSSKFSIDSGEINSTKAGTPPEAVSLANLNAAAESVLKERVDFSRLNLSDALDPQRGLERRQVTGGPAPKLVRHDVEAARLQLEADTIAQERAEGILKSASRALQEKTQRLLSG